MGRFVTVCLLFVATPLLAQEAAPSPAPTTERSAPPVEDAIAAAKRDFSAVKAARGGLEETKLDLPSLSAPEIATGASMPRPQTSTAPDPNVAKKSANWLVDAMMKPEEKDPRALRDKISGAEKRERDLTSAKDPRAAAEKKEDLPPTEKKLGPEFNPLNRYMAGWMTTQDYALLKPGLDSSTGALGMIARNEPALRGLDADASMLGDAGSALDLSAVGKNAPLVQFKPVENPFLQSLAPSATPGPMAFTAPAGPNPSSASAALAPPPEVAPQKSVIPDFAKPSTDDKYFKPLKRF